MSRLDQAGPRAPRKLPRPGAGTHTATGSSASTIAWRFLAVSRGRLPGLLSPTCGRAPAVPPLCP